MMAQGKPNEWLERIKLNEVMQKMNYELYELPKRVIFRYEWILVTGFLFSQSVQTSHVLVFMLVLRQALMWVKSFLLRCNSLKRICYIVLF